MLIDTNNKEEMEKYEILKQRLIREKLDRGEYTASDIALVRVTDFLPVNGVVPSISNVPFVHKINDVAHEAIDVIFDEQGLSWEERKEICREISPLSTQYRSSVHFCLNGVVSSHTQGNFEGNPFVIIEPFKAHENDDNILAVRGEDTYFKEGLTLSSEAVILVDERYADRVLDSDMGQNFQVVYYKGDQKQATESILISMGIVPETVGKDYIIESDTSELITNFISSKGYPQDKHCYSKNYYSDDEKNIVLWQKYAENFYTYLYTNIYGDIETKKDEIAMLSSTSCYDMKAVSKVVDIIKSIGVDNYKTLVDNYNASITAKVASGEYPNNNEILAGASLEFTNQNTLK